MISITELPIAFHCKGCKENFRRESLSSYPVKCPSCGDEKTSSGFLKLPQHYFFKCPPARYNILGSENHCKFVFISMNTYRLELLMDESEYESFEFDFDDYCGQIRSILSSRFEYFGDRAKLKTFYESTILPFEKEHKLNYAKNKAEECLIEIYKLNKQLNDYKSDVEEMTEASI